MSRLTMDLRFAVTLPAALSLVLGIGATLASWLPARRAMRVDPAVVLRQE